MAANDRLFSLRTVLHVVVILTLGSGIGLGWNWKRGESDFDPSRRKHIDIQKQYFPAAVKSAANGGTGATGGSGDQGTDPVPAPANPSGSEGDSSTSGSLPGGTETGATDPAITDPSVENPAPPVRSSLDAYGLQPIPLADCKDLVGSEIAVFVDARDLDLYLAGHIPGAIFLHHYNSEELMTEPVRSALSAAFMVIVYCNGGDCEDSINLAMDLIGVYGLANENVYVFEGGMEEWQAAGLPIVVGANRG